MFQSVTTDRIHVFEIVIFDLTHGQTLKAFKAVANRFNIILFLGSKRFILTFNLHNEKLTD